jgi:AcrR family transcriptional regulator
MHKRQKIIKSALGLIAKRGFHGVPMSMIAKRAGVGAGTIYRYFESRDHLVREVFVEVESCFVAGLRINC